MALTKERILTPKFFPGPELRLVRPETSASAENLRQAAKILTEGGLILWDLTPTPGLAVDGTNHKALEKLMKAKGVKDPSRPFVSTTSLDKLGSLINIHPHHPLIKPFVLSPQKLLHRENDLVFYRFHAQPDLEPPLVKIKNGIRSIVLLVHDDQRINTIVDEGMKQKQQTNFIITGSSANQTGEEPPNSFKEVSPSIRELVDFELKTKPLTLLETPLPSPITIVDLTTPNPYCLRGETDLSVLFSLS